MANTKITSLTAIATSAIVSGDKIPIVDVSDTTQAATGTTKNFDGGDILFKSVGGTISANTTFSGTATVSTLVTDKINPSAAGGSITLGNPNSTTPLLRLSGNNSLDLAMTISDVLTDSATKTARLACEHYLNAEEDFAFITAQSSSTNNSIFYGGNTGSFNAATQHAFYCGTANDVTTGTEVVRITSSLLNVTGTVQTDALRIDQTPTSGAVTLSHYITISANGTTYRIPVGTA